MDPPSYDSTMPSTYQSEPASNPSIVDIEYLKTPQGGMIKIGELVFSITAFICACVWASRGFASGSGEWVQFVSITSFIVTIILLILYLFDIVSKIPPNIPWLLMNMINYSFWAICWFISAIVASVYGGLDASVGAAAFFCWVSFLIYTVDLGFRVMAWRQSEPQAAQFDNPIPAPDSSKAQY